MSHESPPELSRPTLVNEQGAVFAAPGAPTGGPHEPRTGDHASPASETAVGEGARPLVVLLVEDDALIRMDAADMLVDAGYEVADAEYGPDALAILEARAIDVLVTDVGLPGMSGLELAERACRLQPGIGVVFATGDTELPQARTTLGAAVFLCKPYDGPALADSVRRSLDGQRT